MSRNYDHLDKDDYNIVRIKPEGWVDKLVIDTNFHSCGQAESGIGIRLGSESAGGVLTLDDLMCLNNIVKEHFENLSKKLNGTEE